MIPDAIVEEIKKEATDFVKANLYKAAAHLADKIKFPISKEVDGIETKSVEFLKAIYKNNDVKFGEVTKKAAVLLDSTEETKSAILGAFKSFDFKSNESLLGQSMRRQPRETKTTRPELRGKLQNLLFQNVNKAKEKKKNQTGDRTELHLVKLTCKDDGSELVEILKKGGLQINLAGIGISSDSSRVKGRTIRVSEDFKTGDGYTFKSSDPYITLPWKDAGTFPKSFSCTLFLCEIDGGGFAEFIDNVWDQVDNYIVKIVASLVQSTAVGASIGSVIPGAGTIIGMAVGAAVGEFINSMKDDVFNEKEVHILIENENDRFKGNSLRSERHRLKFTHKKVEFQLTYYWKIAKEKKQADAEHKMPKTRVGNKIARGKISRLS
jgi:hypothetical protein